jgi:predicted acylesterase/phospholipase RssA
MSDIFDSDHAIRVALVLNGGVSLAVWMGGVVHELDLARRASVGATAPKPQEYDQTLSERWAKLCLRDGERRRIVVDVIAGTSAGGLNGSLLATAIAHNSTLDPPDEVPGPWLRQRWSALAALTPGHLLPKEDPSPRSILDGKFFLNQLSSALDKVATAGEPQEAADAVTLFVTASGLGVQQFVAEDAGGQAFDVPDHRYLFRFTNDERLCYRGKGDRGEDPYETVTGDGFSDIGLLAHASRCSASFPGAFEPVQESPRMSGRPPRELPRWNHPPSWLVDGGVLDNAPFGPVLDVVARRPVTSSEPRYVLYVVPSAGIGRASTEVQGQSQPSWRTAVLSAVQYPREIDFRGDVEQLEQLLRDADASWSDTQRLFDRCVTDNVADDGENTKVLEAARLLHQAYVRGRAAGGVWEALSSSRGGRATALNAGLTLSSKDVDSILSHQPAWVPAPDGPTLPTVRGTDGTSSWPWGTGPAERVVGLILRALHSSIDDAVTNVSAGADVSALRGSLSKANDVLQRVLAVRDAVTDAITKAGYHPDHGVAAITCGVNDIFHKLDVSAALGKLFVELQSHIPAGQLETALAVEVVSRCTSARTPLQRSAPFRFLRLGPDIALPLLADDEAGSVAAGLGDRILYGTQVGHFGAFGSVEWRRWDWLMGRLHSVVHLGSLLGADSKWIMETQRLVLAAEGWTLKEVTDHIARLANDFPVGGGATALLSMRNELNATKDGRNTICGLVDRLVAVSGGLTPRAGAWIKAMAARRDEPGQWYLQWARWFTGPARRVLWNRMVSQAELNRERRPAVLDWWPALTVFAFAVALGLVVLAVIPAARAHLLWSVTVAVLAGVIATIGIGLVVLWRLTEWGRAWLSKKVAAVPAIPEAKPETCGLDHGGDSIDVDLPNR